MDPDDIVSRTWRVAAMTNGYRSRWRTLVHHAQRHGIVSAISLLVLHPLERFSILRIGGVYRTPTASPDSCPPLVEGMEARFLSGAEIEAQVRAGAPWFFPLAVARSQASGERCFAILERGTVSCSRWIAPGPLRQLGVDLVAPPHSLFLHRIFTMPEARGRGLAGVAKMYSDVTLRAEGVEWTLSTILATNGSSIALSRKSGATRVGWIVQVGPDEWNLAWLFRTSEDCPQALI
jgi:hypothetical protein